MKQLRVAIVVVAALAVSGAASAQFVSPAHILPVVAKVTGLEGSSWVTDVSISNLSPERVEVTAMFYRENQSNSNIFFVPSHTVTLEAGETLTVEDVLGSWFPDEGDTKGTLVLLGQPVGGGTDARLAVSARIFDNFNPAETYGQTVPSSLVNLMVGRGVSVLTGAAWSSRVRSNVGVLNLSFSAIDVEITTYDAGGSEIATRTRSVPAFSMMQWRLNQLGVSALEAPGRVEVRLAESSLPADPCVDEIDPGTSFFPIFEAYISRVDNASNDAEFQLGQNDWSEYEDECGDTPDGGCR